MALCANRAPNKQDPQAGAVKPFRCSGAFHVSMRFGLRGRFLVFLTCRNRFVGERVDVNTNKNHGDR